jgi:hypothetical protein
MTHHHSLLREATDAGFFGALAVFLWFLLQDAITGQPFRTPSLLGQALIYGDPLARPGLDFVAIVAYSALHLILFNLLGFVLVGLVHLAIRQPTLLFGLFLGFVIFEVLFVGLAYTLVQGFAVGSLSWWSLVVGNLVAILVMGAYLRRKHRIIPRWLARVPLGDTGDEPEVNTADAWHAMGRYRHPWWKRVAVAARLWGHK